MVDPSLLEKNINWGIGVLKDMIAIPTVNPPGEKYWDFAKYSKEVLESIGFTVNVVEVPREHVEKYFPEYAGYPRYIILARYGSGRPIVHFNGHYDVVPPGSGWSRDPFKPEIEGDRLYGRGSCDMKGGITAALIASKTIIESYRELKGSIEIALVPDEEIGGETGTGYLISILKEKPDHVVISEPSGSETLWIGHRGALPVLVEVYGKQAHGSTPWLGVNAFEYMVKIANRFIEDYKRIIERKESKYTYDDPRGAKPTIMVGGEVRGGAKVNVVPGYMAFSIDRRIIVEESVEEVENEIKNFVEELRKDYPEVKIEVKVLYRIPPAITDPQSTTVRKLVEASKGVIGKPPKMTVCLGGLDMRFYTGVKIEAVTYGPGPLIMAHQANEYVSLEELNKVARVYVKLLESTVI